VSRFVQRGITCSRALARALDKRVRGTPARRDRSHALELASLPTRNRSRATRSWVTSNLLLGSMYLEAWQPLLSRPESAVLAETMAQIPLRPLRAVPQNGLR
jgi:hypothetical protein